MSRKFIGSNKDKSSRRTWYYRAKFEVDAYTQQNAGSNEIKDITFFEDSILARLITEITP